MSQLNIKKFLINRLSEHDPNHNIKMSCSQSNSDSKLLRKAKRTNSGAKSLKAVSSDNDVASNTKESLQLRKANSERQLVKKSFISSFSHPIYF